MNRICTSIREKTSAGVLRKIAQAEKAGADIIEIWMGELKDPDITEFTNSTKIPLLINCKAADEQGSFTGNTQEKTALFLQAITAGVTYIDIGADSDSEFIKEIIQKKADTKIILSTHYFNGTPGLPHLTSKLAKIQKYNPDIVKFAAMPRIFKDVVTMIRLADKLASKHIPHIVISMGELGKITRIASPVLRNEMTFAALTKASATAPGQLSIKELHKVYKIL